MAGTSAVDQIAFRTPISAVQSTSGPTRVYFLDNAGGIREALSADHLTWTGGDTPIAVGKIGTPIAAISKEDVKSMVMVHYLSPENKLCAVCRVAGGIVPWINLNGLFDIPVAPYSQIGACFLPGTTLRDRVYVQMADNTIQQFWWDEGNDKYVGGTSLGPGLPGTAIAATSFVGPYGESIRVYFQAPDKTVVEYVHENGPFTKSNFSIPLAMQRCAIAVTPCVFPYSTNGPSLRLYYTGLDNNVHEKCNDVGTWFDGGFVEPCIPGASLGLISWGEGADMQVRLYAQAGYLVTAVSELCYGIKPGWYQGRMGLPPAGEIPLDPVADK